MKIPFDDPENYPYDRTNYNGYPPNVRSGANLSERSDLQQVFSNLLDTAIDKVGDMVHIASDAAPSSLDAYFNEASRVYGVEKQFLLAVAKTESNFTPTATSGSGAMGIMQLMPATAESMNVEHPYDPYENIMGGAKLLAIYLDKYDGDKAKTLAAYNAGGNRVDEYGGVPNEIWGYVNKVMGYYREGIDIPGASSTYAASNGAGSVTYASQSVTDKLKTEFSKFPEHQSYEMFLQELTTELQSEETPSDADQAYRMLLGSAKNAIDRVRNQILADPTLLARGQSDLRIGDVDDDEDEEDWEIDDIDEDDEDYEDDDIDDIDDEDDYDDDDEYDYDDEDD